MGLRRASGGRRLAERLLHPRVRTWVLVALSVLLTGAAVVIGLPPQSDLPAAYYHGIIALPVLPEQSEPRGYSVRIRWHVNHTPRTSASLVTDTYWTEDGPITSERGLPVYLAVSDDVTAAQLRTCGEPSTYGPLLTEVTALPPQQRDLLNRFDRNEYGLIRSDYTFLRLDDLDVAAGSGYPFASCGVDPASMITKDDVELHLAVPDITVVTPAPTGGREKDRTQPAVLLARMPPGWSPQDARAVNGTRRDGETSISWFGAEPTDPLTGEPTSRDAGVKVFKVGPVTLEATSLNAARQADRRLFWSGLLVGIAGACLLMLFESLPWRATRPTMHPSQTPGDGEPERTPAH